MKQLGDIREKALIDIKRKLKEGKTNHEIAEFLRQEYRDVRYANVSWLIKEAQENLSREIDFNLRDVMIKHTSRYEQIWKKNYANPFSKMLDDPDEDLEDKDVRKTLYKIANHYMTAAKALQQKEKMLGLVHNRMDVQLKNEMEEQESKDEASLSRSNLDLTKLSLEEKKEILVLLKKAKGEQDLEPPKLTTTVTIVQQQGVIQQKYEEVVSKFDVEDIEHEELPQDDVVYAQRINKNLIKSESEKFHEDMDKKLESEKKKRIEANKKLLIERLKKKNQ